MDRKDIMIDLLERVLSGGISPEEALGLWPDIHDPSDTRLMQNAWHILYHYYTDEDIRMKEKGYENRQKAALKEVLVELIGTGNRHLP